MSVSKVDGGIRTDKGTFLPFIKVKGGKDYLQVMHRLVWFREEHPEGSISTEQIELNDKFAVMRATVSLEGKLLATGFKREDLASFGDYMEKAETGAIGRALAACGYGTQFAPELDEGDRIVDSPVGSSAKVPLLNNATLFTNQVPKAYYGEVLDSVNTPAALNSTNTTKRGFKRVDVQTAAAAPVAATAPTAAAEEDYT